jgi:GDP-4-dehydro-6-deoxy-D-mannose reductase
VVLLTNGKRVLITGISGFVGSWLAEFLLKQGLEVSGIVRWRSKLDNIELIKDKINLVYADMKDGHSVNTAISNIEPDYIFHLSAQSYVPMSWTAPVDTMENNVIGTINLLEAVIKSKCSPVIHIAGSSEEYGLVCPDELPIKETNQLRPLSPYGISKVAEDLLGTQYNKTYGLKTVITRAFNHTGPRRGEVFVTSNFAKQIVEIEKGQREPGIYVGNLNSIRDFTDVRDIVKAYWLAVTKCDYGEVYNICSEKERNIQNVLDLLISKSTVKNKIKIIPDLSRMRSSDVPILKGDCSKFKNITGWKNEVPFDTTMEDLLSYWREILK